MIRGVLFWTAIATASVALSPMLYAQPNIPLTHRADVRSPDGTIIYGDVHVGVGWHGGRKTMRADFTFRPGFAALDNDYDFHWFQIIDRDTWPLNDSNGNPLATPYVDPPNGGYQGQPEDDHPFYWNRPGMGFPDDWSQPHRRTEGRFSRIWDQPNAPEKRDEFGEVLFKTFLVITNHGQDHFAVPNVFGKILGFSWAIGSRDLNGNGQVDAGENFVEFRDWIDIRREKSKIQQAFANSGFAGWDTVQVPEPASMLALAIGLAGLAYRRRRVA